MVSRKDLSQRQRLQRSIRELSPKTQREPCFICGKHKHVSQAHHLVPVKAIVDYTIKYNLDWYDYAQKVVWLCPTHHAIWHLIDKAPTNIGVEMLEEMSEDERKAFRTLNAMTQQEHGAFSKLLEAAYQGGSNGST